MHSLKKGIHRVQKFFVAQMMCLYVCIIFLNSCSLTQVDPTENSLVGEENTVEIPDNCTWVDEKLSELTASLHEKKYEEGIYLASSLLQNPCFREYYGKITFTLAEIFEQKGEYFNAIHFFINAFVTTPDSVLKSDSLKQAISAGTKMDPVQLTELLMSLESGDNSSGMLYEVGMAHFREGRVVEALTLLSAFLREYPDHQKQAEVFTLVDTMLLEKNVKREIIGVLLPLTGNLAHFGKKALHAIELAISDFNRSQQDFSFRIVVKDTALDPDIARSAVKELKAEGAVCIIGPLVTADVAAETSNALKMPIVVLAQKEELPAIGDYVFRNFITPKLQAETLVEYFMTDRKFTRFAVIHPKEKYGETLTQAFVESVAERGGSIVTVETYAPGNTDFKEQINHMITGFEIVDNHGNKEIIGKYDKPMRNTRYRATVDFDVLFIPDTLTMVNLIAPQLQYHGISNVVLAGTNIWYSELFAEIDKKYLEKAVFPVGFFPKRNSYKIKQFVRKFKNITGESPSYIDAISYDTAFLIMSALSKKGILSREDLVWALNSLFFTDGVTCPVFFDQTGEPSGMLDLLQVVNEEIVLLKPSQTRRSKNPSIVKVTTVEKLSETGKN